MSNQQFKMISSNYKDSDGFQLQFEENCSEGDRKFYMKEFPRVDLIAQKKPHCTTCSIHIGTSPISEKIVRTHSILGVSQCVKCFAFYNSGEFGKGEDGSEYYCRWCGQGGEVFCCSSCPCVFCTKCIKTNMDSKYVRLIEKNDDWSCFICDKTILRKQRAEHWALRNFMIKQLEKIRKITVSSEEELNVLLNEDVSVCCPGRKKKVVPTTSPVAAPVKKPLLPSLQPSNKRRSETPPPLPTVPKKMAPNPPTALRPVRHNVYNYTAGSSSSSSTGTPSPQPTRSAFLVNAHKSANNSPAQPKKNNDEIVCTPDLPGFLDDLPKDDPPPLAPMRPSQPTATRGGQSTTVATAGGVVPIFHNVNGYQIDLNHAARQEVYRLPNGKLIQVRKTNPPAAAPQNCRPQIRPAQQTLLRNLAPVTLNGNTGVRRPPFGVPNIVRSPSSLQIRPHVRPTVPSANNNNYTPRFTVSNEGRLVATPSFSNQQQQPQPVAKPVAMQSQSSVFTQQNGSISVARASYPKTPFGAARNEFEDRIISALEICQHTINKMITLTNSSSFKGANNFQDLKGLYTHLQYLFTYTTGKLTNFNDVLKTSIENLVKKEQSLREKTDIDELEILEKTVDVVDVLSDDEEDELARKNGQPPAGPRLDEKTGRIAPPKARPLMTKITFPTTNYQKRNIPLLSEDDMKNETIREIVDNDQRLMARNAIKLEKIDDSKNAIIQKLLKAHQERKLKMQAEDAVSDKEASGDAHAAVAENGVEKVSDDVVMAEPDNANDVEKPIDEGEKEGEAAEVDKEGRENSEKSDTEKSSVKATNDGDIDTVELSSDEEFEIEPEQTEKATEDSLEDSNKENVDGNVDDETTVDSSGDKQPTPIIEMEIDPELPAELMDVDVSIEEAKDDTNGEDVGEKSEPAPQVVEPENGNNAEPEKEDVEKSVVDEPVAVAEETKDVDNQTMEDLLEPISPEGSNDGLKEVDDAEAVAEKQKVVLDDILEGLNKITDKSKQPSTPSKNTETLN